MNRFAFTMVLVVVVVLGLSATVFSFYKCGWHALLLGNRAVWAAATGMCDE